MRANVFLMRGNRACLVTCNISFCRVIPALRRGSFRNSEVTLFIFIQPVQCLSHVTKAENLTHILRHRPRFAVKGINLLMPIR